jgi:D-alanyl-D-alanine carboxypeptidase
VVSRSVMLREASLALLLLFASACSGSDDAGGQATGGGAGAAGSGGAAGAGLAGAGGAGEAGASAECVLLGAAFEEALAAARAKTGSRDAALAVSTPACGLHSYADGESGLSGNELFRIGSVTKTYVSAAILRLVEEGKLSLDATMDAWVSGVPNGDAITVRMLLNHTSGVFNYTTDPVVLSDLKQAWTPEELVQQAAGHAPTSEPGASWSYSNTNYVILGIIAEKISGKGIAELIRSELLAAHALEATFFDGEEPLPITLAPGYSSSGADNSYAVHPSITWTAGAIAASAADTARWIELFATGKVLGASAQAELTTTVSTPSPTLRYGLGLLVLSTAATGGLGPALGHDGSINGYHTHAFHLPDVQATVVSIVNQDGASPNDLTAAAFEVLRKVQP